MKRIGDNIFYSKQDIATIINRSTQMVHLWTKWSDELEAEGKERLIPKPIRLDNNYRYWTEEDKDKILEFSEWVKKNRGAMVEFSKRQWSKEAKKEYESRQSKSL